CAFILVDSNVTPQNSDLEFINWCGESHVPFVIVFTKTDKSKPAEIEANIQAFKDTLLEEWEELPQMFITSVNKKEGKDELLEFIEGLNKNVGIEKK
ncbi:MAG: YihA family ribosome biogenesis GTP-binding protein, partial [Saprospiraceae bacterium]